jgi:hypothetical protein
MAVAEIPQIRYSFWLPIAGLALFNLALCLFWQKTFIEVWGIAIPRIPLNEALGGLTIALIGSYLITVRPAANKRAGIFLGVVGLLVSILGIIKFFPFGWHLYL